MKAALFIVAAHLLPLMISVALGSAARAVVLSAALSKSIMINHYCTCTPLYFQSLCGRQAAGVQLGFVLV